MGNQIIVVSESGGSFSLSTQFDLGLFKKNLTDRKASASLIPFTPENASLLAEQVSKNNAALKEAKAVVKEAEKPILDALSKAEEPLTAAISEAEGFFKDYQAQALAQKKLAFKEKAKTKFFDPYNTPDENGALLDFEAVYSESMYGLSETELASAIALKMAKAKVSEDKISATLRITCTKGQKDELEDWLISKRISYFIE